MGLVNFIKVFKQLHSLLCKADDSQPSGRGFELPNAVQQCYSYFTNRKRISKTIFINKDHISLNFQLFSIKKTIRHVFSRFLEPGSYPVVSPDGGRFPEFMSVPKHAHNLTFRPENGRHSLLVTSPVPGEWYMLAYINRQQKKDFVQQVILIEKNLLFLIVIVS